MDWKNEIIRIVDEKGIYRKDGTVASEKTKSLTKAVVIAAVKKLHSLGYKITKPQNLKERHIAKLVNEWYDSQRKLKGIESDLSKLRRFCEMMGKNGMVQSLKHYLPHVDPALLVVKQAAQSPKSWAGNGINFSEIINRVELRDERLANMLRMQLAFGLRREEVMKCNPHVQDDGDYLIVLPGQGKGGRPRLIRIVHAAQRKVLDHVKSRLKKNEVLGWTYMENGQKATLRQNLDRYNNLMQACGITKKNLGVTAHGLRAQFAENMCLLLDLLPASLGGTKDQMAKDDLKVKQVKISEKMGHHRPEVNDSYCQQLKKGPGETPAERRKRQIEAALERMGEDLPDVTAEQLEDCLPIVMYAAREAVDLTLKQARALWTTWCDRLGSEWTAPTENALILVEAAASDLLKRE